MPAPADLVHQQSASTGTGNFTLSTVNGKQSFSTAFGTGATTDVFDYFISNQGAAEWERGTGHMSSSTTLVRDTVKESTNSNAAVSFSAGTKDVTSDIPAVNQIVAQTLGIPLLNGKLVYSVSSSALTVAVKTMGGNDPSALEPVLARVRDATASTDGASWLVIASALSITVASGGTVGAVSATAFRLWTVLFNDGGTARLGVINCVSGTNIYPLAAWQIASSTLVSSSATAAQTFYTNGAGVTSKPYAILGYASWESGLTTAGTWASAPTRAQLFGPGVPTPGSIIQAIGGTSAGSTTSSATFVDVTGATLSLTMSSAANLIGYDFTWHALVQFAGAGTNSEINYQMLRGASVLVPGGGIVGMVSGGGTNQQSNAFGCGCGIEAPNSVSSQTFKLQHEIVTTGTPSGTTSNVGMRLTELMT